MSQLPVADTATVRAYAKRLIRQHRSRLVRMLSLYALAAFMALIPAYIIGEITNYAADHQLTSHRITIDVGILFVSSMLYAGLSFLARRRSYLLGETVFAQLREELENLDAAILSLERLQQAGPRRRGRPPKALSHLSRMVRAAKAEPDPDEPLQEG